MNCYYYACAFEFIGGFVFLTIFSMHCIEVFFLSLHFLPFFLIFVDGLPLHVSTKTQGDEAAAYARVRKPEKKESIYDSDLDQVFCWN